jgi:4'-phosphopantetheinyl transferase EntD
MPLIRDEFIKPDVRLAVWHITEAVEDFIAPRQLDLSAMHSEFRKKEVLAVYALLAHMTGKDDLIIGYDETGRPEVLGWKLSISHTKGWAALILSKTRTVAIDVEYMSDRVTRVTDRFLRPDEKKGSLFCQLVSWSAKETVYKLLSEEHLQYFEMRIKPFTESARGRVEVEDLKEPKSVMVDFEINDDFVLTYATGD